MHRGGWAVRAALALVLALSVAGCGSGKDADEPKPNGIEDMSPGKALKLARAAVRELDDLWLSGRGYVDLGTGLRHVDLTVIVADAGCSLSFSSTAVGRSQVKRVGRTEYFHADAKALTALYGLPAAAAAQARSKWFSRPATDEIARQCKVASSYFQGEKCKRGKEGEVGNTPTIAFKCTDEGHPTTLHVSTVDEPLVLLVKGTDDAGPYEVRLVDYDTGIDVDAPKGDVIAVPR